MTTFITVKVSDFSANLAVAKSYLESNGITCYLKDDISIYVSSIAGGVKLQVLESDYEKAMFLLKEGGFLE